MFFEMTKKNLFCSKGIFKLAFGVGKSVTKKEKISNVWLFFFISKATGVNHKIKFPANVWLYSSKYT